MAVVLAVVGVVAVCLMGERTSPTALLLRPQQAPGFGQARLTSLSRINTPVVVAGKKIQADPYTAKPAEADYVDNAAAGFSFGGRREVRQQERLRTQKLVQQATIGSLGKQFDDVYARKHWFENADANDDATPELDIPRLKSEPSDAIPTTPRLAVISGDARAKVLDREAGLMNPVVGDMKADIKMATERRVEKAVGGDAGVAEGMNLLKADSPDPTDHAAAGAEQAAPEVGAADAKAAGKAPRKALSDDDLMLLQDARQRQAIEAGSPMADAFPSMQQMSDMKTPKVGGGTPLLAGLEPTEEPKAIDNPIGVASAAKILKDAEMFDQSTNGDAMDKWKDAAKGAGPAILDSIKDDVSTFSPFPKSSLSERMEVEDVWNRARANTKSAGKLDGDAKETKDTVENAEAQAEGQAYLAANEAAAVDAYDVSFPNPDMMAKGGAKKMSAQALAISNKGSHAVAMQGQALATHPHQPHMLHGQASAVGGGRHRAARASQALASSERGHVLLGQAQARGMHKMLQSRVQALAEVEHYEGEGVGSEQNTAVQVALNDERAAKRTVQALQMKVAVAKGEAKEAARLRGFTSKPATAARAEVTKYQLAILREGGEAQEARKLATELAGSMPIQKSRGQHMRTERRSSAWQQHQHKAEMAASADRSKRALVMRLEDRAARLRKQLDVTELQANRANMGGHHAATSKSSVRRMVDSDGGSVGGSWGSAFGDATVPHLMQQQLEGEDEGDEGEGDEDDQFDRSRAYDERVKVNNNKLSDIINGALGDESMSMDDIDQLSTAAGQENVHGALYPPYNNKAMRDANHMTVNNAGGWSVNNNMNQGEDPLEPFGVYDTRTAKDIYEPAEEEEGAQDEADEAGEDEDGEAEAKDPSHPENQWWKKAVKEGQRKPVEKAEEEDAEAE